MMIHLTVFYDGQCPLCLAEMRQLQALDQQGRLGFVDINGDDFSKRYPAIDQAQASRILHGQLDTGERLLGLDVTYRAWSLVGKHRWLALLRWPVVKPIADIGYRIFARYRYQISYWLTGQPRCNSCSLDEAGVKPSGSD